MAEVEERESVNGLEIDRSIREESLPQAEDVKQTYKSFKKKYKKMRVRFDEQMRHSNELFSAEHAAKDTARRLAQQNDQLMELLLDVNNCAQIPADKRIDLSFETPALADVPALVTSDELTEVAALDNLKGQGVYKDICSIIEEKAAIKATSKPPKSLAYLLNNTHHISTRSPLVAPALLNDLGVVDGTGPIAYLTADQIDDYISDIDISLGKPSTTAQPQANPPENVAHRNPVSVYNWLRRNEPKIFLQDGEGSEKSHGKPGSLRGAGKRASMPMPSHGDALEIVEEDGLGYDPTIAGLDPGTAKGKRKREDDGGYHPKLGAPDGKVKKPRVSRKKKESTGEASTASAKKGKGKARASSPMALDSASANNGS